MITTACANKLDNTITKFTIRWKQKIENTTDNTQHNIPRGDRSSEHISDDALAHAKLMFNE